MDLKQFKLELERRGISENEVPQYLMKDGKMMTPASDALPVFKNALRHVTTGATIGAAGSMYLGDKLGFKKPTQLALGGMALGGAIGGYIHNRKYIQNGRMRGIYRDQFLNQYSDMSKDSSKVKLPESEDEGEVKLPEVTSRYGEVRKISRTHSFKEIGDLARSKWGKVIIGATALATIAAIATPKIRMEFRRMNTMQIDVSGYRLTDDANTVQRCVSRFSDFFHKNPLQSTLKYRYEDMEKVYLDALDAIDRSSPNQEADRGYLKAYWDTIYSLYNSSNEWQKLDNYARLNPNVGTLIIR